MKMFFRFCLTLISFIGLFSISAVQSGKYIKLDKEDMKNELKSSNLIQKSYKPSEITCLSECERRTNCKTVTYHKPNAREDCCFLYDISVNEGINTVASQTKKIYSKHGSKTLNDRCSNGFECNETAGLICTSGYCKCSYGFWSSLTNVCVKCVSPYSVVSSNYCYYKPSTLMRTWNESQAYCKSINGTLAFADDGYELFVMQSYVGILSNTYVGCILNSGTTTVKWTTSYLVGNYKGLCAIISLGLSSNVPCLLSYNLLCEKIY